MAELLQVREKEIAISTNQLDSKYCVCIIEIDIETVHVFICLEDNCTIDALSSLEPKMPAHLFIERPISFDNLRRISVLCSGQKLLRGPVNSTFENGTFLLNCSAEHKSWLQPPEWPRAENCVSSNVNCTMTDLPPPPGE